MDDKSGAFVLANRDDYISSAKLDLTKQGNIEEVQEDFDKKELIENVELEVAVVIDAMVRNEEMKSTTGDFIKHKVKENKLARYYCNWKCHKFQPTMTEFAAAAVRGIVSCSGTADEHACDYLDFILNPGMQNQRSYLKGTKHFLQWIEVFKEQYPELPPLFGILTIDYTAMYVKMPDNLILPAVQDYLTSRTVQIPSTEKTLELLEITANNNYFEFGNTSFKQTGGTSIGKKHAPDLCCLGAGKLEEDLIFPSESFQSLVMDDSSSIDPKERFFKRFIDDMFAATNGTEQQAQQFVDWMNTLWPGLAFTFEWSNREITFLDVKLIMDGGKLETDRFVKPTNPQLFLHYSSNHPSSVFKSIVYGQGITVRVICSKEEFVVRHVENLKTKFAERGYPVEMVEENLQRGIRLERADFLKPKPVYPHQACPLLPGKRKFTPTFIITYNPHNPPLHQWLKQVHFILLADKKMEKAFPTAPTVSYRQARNLKQILVRSSLRELLLRATNTCMEGSFLGTRPFLLHIFTNYGNFNIKLCNVPTNLSNRSTFMLIL